MTDTINYTMKQGKTFVQVTEGVRISGDPFDLTDYTYRGQIRQAYTGSLVDNLSVALSGSAAEGILTIQLAASQSAEIDPGDYFYDVEVVSGSVIREWQRGEIRVLPEVTK